MERAIGEIFDFNGAKLRVKDTGKCFPSLRTDDKNVIFVEVESDENKEK